MTAEHSSAWMFIDWPERSIARSAQLMQTALTRILVLAVSKPFRPAMRWLDEWYRAWRFNRENKRWMKYYGKFCTPSVDCDCPLWHDESQ